MKHLYTSIIFILLICRSQLSFAQVEIRDTVVKWKHHHYELHKDFSIKTYSTNDADIDEENFNGKVVENEYFKLTIVPDFGGRIISYVYKPNGNEYLYQNPVGTPYLINANVFYYDWLMLWGGIFPTFPEPEHGKAWCRPWNLTVALQTADEVVISLSYTDNDEYDNHPGGYDNGIPGVTGITGITCKVEIIIGAGKTYFDYKVSLINNKSEQVTYEYWTNTAMAPGSEAGSPAATLNSEMVVPIETVEAAYNQNGWASGEILNFGDVNFLSEWENEGILYAMPELGGDYWGIINHDNEEGLFRIADNLNHTVGLKFWTWGKGSVNANPNSFSNGGNCPIIELWAGVSRQFWWDAFLSSGATKQWNESYYPTIGLSVVDGINKKAAIGISVVNNISSTQLTANLIFTLPKNTYRLVISLDGETDYPQIINKSVTASALGNEIELALSHSEYNLGDYIANFEVYDNSDNLVLSGSKSITLSATTGIAKLSTEVEIYAIGNRVVMIKTDDSDTKRVELYDLSGKRLISKSFSDKDIAIQLNKTGVYIVRMSSNKGTAVKKLYVR